MSDLFDEMEPLEAFAGLLGEWGRIWSRAESLQRDFPDDVRLAAEHSTRDVRESLLSLLPAVAMLHPEVVASMRATLAAGVEAVRAAAGVDGDLGEDVAVDAAAGVGRQAPTRVLVVASNRAVARGLKLLLGVLSPAHVELAGTVGGVAELREACLATRPDVVVVHVDDERVELGVVEALARDFPAVAPVVLIPPRGDEAVVELHRRGAAAVVVAGMPTAALVSAVTFASSGWSALPRGIADALIERYSAAQDFIADLDDDDMALWRDIARGRTDAQIAKRDHLSLRTVRRRTAALYRRIGADNRAHAAMLAGRYGILGSETGS